MQTAEKTVGTLEALKQKIEARTARVGIVGSVVEDPERIRDPSIDEVGPRHRAEQPGPG